MLGYFNNWDIIKFSLKNTPSGAFKSINQVVLDSISNNMISLFQTGKYGTMNKIDETTTG